MNLKNIDTIVSYGGNQSNMLYALAYFCFIKQKKLIYYTTKIPNVLKNNPTGNFKFAIEHKAIIKTIAHVDFDKTILKNKDKHKNKKNELWINQGGAEKNSRYGIKQLALELKKYFKKDLCKYSIFVASGTGTTAFYLQKYLQNNTIYTTPCVGNEEYLLKQFKALDIQEHNSAKKIPTILNTTKKYHFAKCYKEFYDLYKDMLKKGVEFDLLYDMKSLISIKNNINSIKEKIIYIHCGGTHGNESMKNRYIYKDIV